MLGSDAGPMWPVGGAETGEGALATGHRGGGGGGVGQGTCSTFARANPARNMAEWFGASCNALCADWPSGSLAQWAQFPCAPAAFRITPTSRGVVTLGSVPRFDVGIWGWGVCPMRPLATLRYLWQRVRPTLARPVLHVVSQYLQQPFGPYRHCGGPL